MLLIIMKKEASLISKLSLANSQKNDDKIDASLDDVESCFFNQKLAQNQYITRFFMFYDLQCKIVINIYSRPISS